jgi:hypothetical protein
MMLSLLNESLRLALFLKKKNKSPQWNKIFLRRPYKGFFKIPPFMIVYSINPEEVGVLVI